MSRRALRILALAAAFVLLTAQECELDEFVQKPGSISVTNIGNELAVIAIIADDVKSYPTLAGGSHASAQTNVGGAYQVRVVMTPENANAYRQSLAELRRLVERQIDGSASPAEKTQLFINLAGLKAAILAFEQANAAGCSGRVTISVEETTEVVATVNWVPQGGAGFWDVTCGSN